MLPWHKAALAVAGAIAGVFTVRRLSNDAKPDRIRSPLDDYAPREPTQPGQCDPVAKPGVKMFREWVIGRWKERPGSPQNIIRDCSQGSPSEHWEGRAWDFMIPRLDVGQSLVDTLLAPDAEGRPNALARRAGIMYLIFNRRMWRAYPYQGAPSGTWTPYNGPSAHTDHVHFSFSRAGARGETSLYRELAAGNV